MEKLAQAVVAPLMRDGNLVAEHAEFLWNKEKRGKGKKGKPALVVVHEAFNALMLSDDGTHILVAEWFKDFLDVIWHHGGDDEMTDIIHRINPRFWR
jgi:hypothetical protein